MTGVAELQIPIPLCKRHYHIVYDLVQPSKQVYVVLLVEPHRELITTQILERQEYLRKHTDFDGHILQNDKVCHTCYKSHLIILQTSKCHSTDADLEQLINDLSKQLSSFTVGSEKDVANNAMNATALKVAKLLLVILLPTIKDIY